MKATSFLLWIHERLVHDGNDPLADYMHTLRNLIFYLTGERQAITTEMAGRAAPGTHDAFQLLAHLEPAIADEMLAESGPVRKLEGPDPKFPTAETLDRMALRYRHDFGLLSASERDNIRTTMRQLYEEAHAPRPPMNSAEVIDYLHTRYVEPSLCEKPKKPIKKAEWVPTADYEWVEREVRTAGPNTVYRTSKRILQRRWEIHYVTTGVTLSEWRDVPTRPAEPAIDAARAAHFDTMVPRT
jgi:hypothetical protein